ncbi:MAG: BlaI/MecI/CopY family transcriptional regulator [Ferruginibacter sp.]
MPYETNRINLKETPQKPTESELEILSVLWERKKATVREVHEVLLNIKDAGYTTTLKLMQIMIEKNLVVRDDSHKTHVYKPNVSKEKTQKLFVNKMIDKLFAGSSAELVLRALDTHTTAEELDAIQSLIADLKSKK